MTLKVVAVLLDKVRLVMVTSLADRNRHNQLEGKNMHNYVVLRSYVIAMVQRNVRGS